MNDGRDGERGPTAEPPPYIRLPWPAVAAGLFVFLGLALAVGLYANRNLRPQLGGVAAPTAAPQGTAAPAQIAAPSTTLLPAFTATPLPTTAAFITVARATPVAVTASLTSEPTLEPLATPTTTPLPTVEPALADEVGQAYLKFWHVTSQALLELDDTHLTEVMDGEYLTSIENRIDELRNEDRAIKIAVVLNYSVVRATSDSASVLDDIEDNSVYVRIGTEEPVSGPTADQLRILYQLHNFAGTWKVVKGVTSE